MDPKFQPTFIPKRPGDTAVSTGKHASSGKGILYNVGSALFVISLLASGAVFAYEKYLLSRISNMQTALEEAKTALNPELVKELSRSHDKIESAKEILMRHVALTNFFSLLESLTLEALRFSRFTYSFSMEKGIVVEMTGEAGDYKTVALQSEIFSKESSIVNPLFSNLDLNEKGNVTFNFEARLTPDSILYSKNVDDSTSEEVSSDIEEGSLGEVKVDSEDETLSENL